ncbi:MAG TPA: flagellar hook-associated protein FlgK [Acidobacteriaceae bacterium]|jgi:flagellar hook-associated protein 1 FlgK|nr:flagellar hook-associated protein FlgK [Acidobacteriaceae bacterium]
MATVQTAFGIATGALDADQEALNVVANNTANVNTPGYTLEVPIWQENDAVSLNGVGFGMGVQVTGPESQRSGVLEQAMQQQTQTESASAARLAALDQVQGLFTGATSANTDTSAASGIGSDVSNLFDTLSSLEANPSDIASRQNVLSAAGSLASDFNSAALQLESQRQSLDEQSSSVVGQANTLLQNVAQLDLQIEQTSPNKDAGTLEDQRQQDLTELSQLIGIRTVPTEDNGLTVTTMNGALLVSEGQAYSITSGESGGVTHYFDAQGNDVTSDLTAGGGQLGGILTARDQDIPQVESALDTLAYSVASQMNTLNEGGSDLDGNAGGAIFGLPASATQADPAGSAAGISVVMTDPAGIAAAANGNGSSDGTNLLLMANQANYTGVTGTTPTEGFSDLVTSLGSLTSEVSSENTSQQAALTQLNNQIGALSGVNLNDEAASLETLEQAYEAASKMFTILDQVMSSALNLGVETAYSS